MAADDPQATYVRVERQGIASLATSDTDLKTLRDHPAALPDHQRANWLRQIRAELARRGRARNRATTTPTTEEHHP